MPESPPDPFDHVMLNGQLVRSQEAVVSVFDRGFQLGDAIFETLLIRNGNPVWWNDHWKRFETSAEQIGIRMPFNERDILEQVGKLIGKCDSQQAVLRLQLSRGVGPRGYSPSKANDPNLLLSLHPDPDPGQSVPATCRLIVSSYRISSVDPVSSMKTSSRLLNVLAKSEADSNDSDDALMLDEHGRVAEATSSNVFWLHDKQLFTPPLGNGILPGTARKHLIHLAPKLDLEVQERTDHPSVLKQADAVFLTNSIRLVTEVISLDGAPLNRSKWAQKIFAQLKRIQ